MRSSDVQLYRPSPGNDLDRTAQLQSLSTDSSKKQLNISAKMEQVNAKGVPTFLKSDQFRRMQIKQAIMEIFMGKLLKSMKKSKSINETKLDMENQKKYIKLTRISQILLLQKQNLELQIYTLQKELLKLNEKYSNTRKHLDGLTLEHMSLWKYRNQLQRDLEDKKMQIETLSENESFLIKELKAIKDLQINADNKRYELNYAKCENENLENVSKHLAMLLGNKIEELDTLKFDNGQLQQEMQQTLEEEKNSMERVENLLNENRKLKEELMQSRVEQIKTSVSNAQADKICERYQELQKEYQQLQQLYNKEIEMRKVLQNQYEKYSGISEDNKKEVSEEQNRFKEKITYLSELIDDQK
ncbi:unnamed protein product [Schistosoma turkestanicum]|nr:unnamed protein product [Schistosoma turkestanicum]